MRGNEVDMELVRTIILKHLETNRFKPGMRTMTYIIKSYHITNMSFYRAVDVLIDRGCVSSVGASPKVYSITILGKEKLGCVAQSG